MAKKEQNDREIEELLNQLRDKTATDAEPTSKTPKKDKKLTDDDVKAMLKRYYGDIDTLPEQKAPAFDVDTTDFVDVSDEPEPKPEPKQKIKSEPKHKPEPKPVEEVVEPEAEPEPVEEVTEPESKPEPKQRIKSEPKHKPEPEPVEEVTEPEAEDTEVEPVEAVEPDEPDEDDESDESDGEELLNDISDDETDDIETESAFTFDEEPEPEPESEPEQVEEVTEPESEPIEEATEPEAEPEPVEEVVESEAEDTEVEPVEAVEHDEPDESDGEELLNDITDDETDDIETESAFTFDEEPEPEPESEPEQVEEVTEPESEPVEEVNEQEIEPEPVEEVNEQEIEPEPVEEVTEPEPIGTPGISNSEINPAIKASASDDEELLDEIIYESTEDIDADSLGKEVTAPTEEPPEKAESVPESTAEAIEESEAEAVEEPEANAVEEPEAKAVEEPEAKAVEEPETEAVEEPETEAVEEPETEAVEEPETEAVEEPETEAVEEPETEAVEEPETEAVEEPETEAVEESKTEAGTADEQEFDDFDVKEWKPSADVSGRTDDGELDLIVALGFGDKLKDRYGEERVRRAEEKLRLNADRTDRDISAYGYTGKEYTQPSDDEKINQTFDNDRRRIIIRLVGTAVLTLLLFLFDHLSLFGIEMTGIFSTAEHPVAHTLLSLLLLCGCAAFSYRQLYDGVLYSIGRRKSGNAILTVAVLALVVYDIVIAIATPEEIILYNFPVALGLLFGVFSDLMRFNRERTTFGLIGNRNDKLYGLCLGGTDDMRRTTLTARPLSFIEGYFKRTGSRHGYPLLLIFSVLPVASVGALLAVAAAVGGLSLGRSLSAFPAAFAFAAPLTWLFGSEWQLLKMTLTLGEKQSGIIGGNISDEYTDASEVIFDDEAVFPTTLAKISNIKLFDNCDIYNTIYNVNALFSAAGGPLRDIMNFTAANLGEPKSVELTGAADHYTEALVDGNTRVCAGSASALKQRGIYIPVNPDDSADSADASVMYAAINGEVSARLCVVYTADENFIKAAKLLASDGITLRITTLDPNIDRGLLFRALGEGVEAGILRKPHREQTEKQSASAAVFTHGEVTKLAEPLIIGRRMRRLSHVMSVYRIVQMSVGATAAALLLFFGCPPVLLAASAVAIQLVGMLPPVLIYHFGVGKTD